MQEKREGQAEASFWLENAAAVIARMEAQFPLYRDIVQPLKRGVLEVSHGLSQLLQAAATADASTLQLAIQLSEFPRFNGMPLLVCHSLKSLLICLLDEFRLNLNIYLRETKHS